MPHKILPEVLIPEGLHGLVLLKKCINRLEKS